MSTKTILSLVAFGAYFCTTSALQAQLHDYPMPAPAAPPPAPVTPTPAPVTPPPASFSLGSTTCEVPKLDSLNTEGGVPDHSRSFLYPTPTGPGTAKSQVPAGAPMTPGVLSENLSNLNSLLEEKIKRLEAEIERLSKENAELRTKVQSQDPPVKVPNQVPTSKRE